MNGTSVKVYSLAKDGSKALSANFCVREFACKDGSDVILVAPELVTVLQKVRTYFKRPVTITSAYRTPAHNKKEGGEPFSQHLYGTAADIVVTGVAPAKVAAYVETLMPNKGGIGIYTKKGFTHIDVREKRSRWNG
jgi:uncharacterized protein YcbK (DUF882 family)